MMNINLKEHILPKSRSAKLLGKSSAVSLDSRTYDSIAFSAGFSKPQSDVDKNGFLPMFGSNGAGLSSPRRGVPTARR